MQWIRIGYNHDTSRNLEIWLYFLKKFQLGFSSKIEVPQLGLARAGTFLAWARSSQKIPARTHLYQLGLMLLIFLFRKQIPLVIILCCVDFWNFHPPSLEFDM